MEVAKLAQIYELIATLPGGYSTFIDAAGSSFSKSERHQLALARALYSNPMVLVVDEPDQTFREGLSRNLKGAITSFLDRGGILIVLSRLGLKTFQPNRRLLPGGWPAQVKASQSRIDVSKSMSNVVRLSEQKLLDSKIGKLGEEN